jgi:hypothetical protein
MPNISNTELIPPLPENRERINALRQWMHKRRLEANTFRDTTLLESVGDATCEVVELLIEMQDYMDRLQRHLQNASRTTIDAKQIYF